MPGYHSCLPTTVTYILKKKGSNKMSSILYGTEFVMPIRKNTFFIIHFVSFVEGL